MKGLRSLRCSPFFGFQLVDHFGFFQKKHEVFIRFEIS